MATLRLLRITSHCFLDLIREISNGSLFSHRHDSRAISCQNRRKTLTSPSYIVLRRSSIRLFPRMDLISTIFPTTLSPRICPYRTLEEVRTASGPQGVQSSIKYLQYLREIPLDSFDVSRKLVTTSLIRALAIEVVLEAGDGTRNIKEIVVLCRELLASNISADFPVTAFLSLNQVVNVEYFRGRVVQSLGQVIECLHDAVNACPPDLYIMLLALADAFGTRFMVAHSNDDYEEATALLERTLHPDQPGVCRDSIRDEASSIATLLS